MSDDLPSASWLRSFRSRLRNWYDAGHRDLPWRNSQDPYAIWVSEVMLQQTTVAAVVPYHDRFLSELPTVTDLAAADEQAVLRLWEGLGYYSRARNLHRAAKVILEDHGGRFPRDVDALNTLPGVGRYTAGAIASFAFDLPAPIVEANTRRLYARLLPIETELETAAGQRELWSFAEHVLPKKAPGLFNQALMELGATVCTPAEPDCESCPVRTCCRAFEHDLVEELPRLKKRPQVTDLTEACVAVRRDAGTGDEYLLRQCPDNERWAGLWDFPRFAADAAWLPQNSEPGPVLPSLFTQAEEAVAELVSVRCRITARLPDIRHSVTRYRIRLLCFMADAQSAASLGVPAQCEWISPAAFSDYPLTKTARKVADRLSGL